jgi:Trk-type K+ transport system membrane component
MALISLGTGVLTVLSLCIAVAPIPLTGWVCYPAAAALGLIALITGILSMAQISRSSEWGRPYATFGITVGTLAILGTVAAIALSIVLFPKFIAFLQEGLRLVEATGQRVVEYIQSLR